MKTQMYNIIQKRKIFYSISTVFLVIGIVSLVAFGLKLGIDFTGGSSMEIVTSGELDVTEIRTALLSVGFADAEIRILDSDSFRITVREVTPDEHSQILTVLYEQDTGAQEVSFSSIGPTIGSELRSKALFATALVFLFIVGYVSWTFRKSSAGPVKSWVFGIAALLALLHDLLLVVGTFAILGKFLSVHIDTLFVTALLTVLGFSVHDTIVVFDRIRERIRIHGVKESFENTVNTSVVETLVRSLATSFTTVLVLVTLLLFGGESITFFVLALIIGMIAGTYSSIAIASPLLVTWYKYKTK